MSFCRKYKFIGKKSWCSIVFLKLLQNIFKEFITSLCHEVQRNSNNRTYFFLLWLTQNEPSNHICWMSTWINEKIPLPVMNQNTQLYVCRRKLMNMEHTYLGLIFNVQIIFFPYVYIICCMSYIIYFPGRIILEFSLRFSYVWS